MAQKQTDSAKRKAPSTSIVEGRKKAEVKVVEVDLQTCAPKKASPKGGKQGPASIAKQKAKPTASSGATRRAGGAKAAKSSTASSKNLRAKSSTEQRASSQKQSLATKTSKKNSAQKKIAQKQVVRTSAAASSTETRIKRPVRRIAGAVKSSNSAQGSSSEGASSKSDVSKQPLAVEKTVTPVMLTPTFEVLKPFRDAAVKTKQLQKQRAKARKVRGDFLAKPLKKGKRYLVDLRVHTPGSRGFFSTGGIDPAPAWVRLARVKGLDMVGITDFYDVSFIDRIQEHAATSTVTVIPGLDMRCRVGLCDEISLIALFPETHTSAEVRAVLNELQVPESAYGDPDYVLSADFGAVLTVVEAAGGVVIPSRVDKTPYRNLAIPSLVEEYGIHAFDLVHPENPDFFRDRWPSGGFTFFSFSNAQALGQIGSRKAAIKLENPGFAGLKERVARRVPQ